MSTVSNTPIEPNNSDGVRFAKLQRFIRNAVDNAGIGYSTGGYLTDISLIDSEGVRFAKLGAWLTLLAENITGGGGGGGGDGTAISGVDPTITSTTLLAAIPTVGKSVPVVKVWVQSSDLSSQTWQLQAGTDANDPTNGVVRPSDYNGATNAKVWYRRGP